MIFDKHFSTQEARALLPKLRRQFQELHDLRDALNAASSRHDASRANADHNGGGGADAVSYLEASGQFQRRLRELFELGIQVKDLNRGLVDFPHLKDGVEVFLCWELEDDTISYWHEIDSGFEGRRLLPS